jgi:phosphatidylinositol alpha-1,6-mannosyltransferase
LNLILHTQILGHGGIPRFNINLNNAYNKANYLTLNDSLPNGSNKNKFKFIWIIIKSLITDRPNKVIIGHLNFVPLSLIIKILTRAKIIVILHGIEAWDKRNKLVFFNRFVEEYWSVSNYTALRFANTNNINKAKIKTIFNTLPKDWNIQKGKYNPFFLSVTRLNTSEGYKGIEESIQVVATVQELMRKQNFSYLIIAHGNDVERHKTLVKELNIGDLVRFESGLTDEKLQLLYEECSFFVLPSTGEGFGIVFLEAMACGKACIGAKNTGAEDVIINGKTGYLVDQNSITMQPYFENLIKNPTVCKQMGEAGLQRLKDNFVFDKFEMRIRQLVEELG